MMIILLKESHTSANSPPVSTLARTDRSPARTSFISWLISLMGFMLLRVISSVIKGISAPNAPVRRIMVKSVRRIFCFS